MEVQNQMQKIPSISKESVYSHVLFTHIATTRHTTATCILPAMHSGTAILNIRHGIKFMIEHVVFMCAADTTNNLMHFCPKGNTKIYHRFYLPLRLYYVCVYLFL